MNCDFVTIEPALTFKLLTTNVTDISQNYLHKHIKIVHESQNDLKRDICNKGFKMKHHLKRHRRIIHQDGNT